MPHIHKGIGDSAKTSQNNELLASSDCPNSDNFCQSGVGSESEEDISEVESFVLAEGEDDAMLSDESGAVGNIEDAVSNNNFLLAAAHSSVESTVGSDYCLSEFGVHGLHPAEAQFDTDTQAGLVALIEAAVASSSDPEVLRRLTNSVSSALDEAASTLARMRAEAAGNSATIASRNYSGLSVGVNVGPDSSSGNSHYSSSINSTTSSSTSNTSQSSSRDSSPSRRPKKILVTAVSEGDVPTVERILQNGGNVHETTEEGDSILALACSAGYIELSQVLISMRANVEDRGEKGDCTPIMEAASAGHCEIINLLLSHNADINAQSSNGNTPLMYATLAGHVDAVRLLIEKGAHLDDQNETGHTALMEAASSGIVPVAKILLQKGANINACSIEFKESALTLACYKGHYDMAKFLLDNGADLEHKTDEMHTALMEACMDGHVEVARLLLDYGASVNMPHDSFESPLTLAACGGHSELVLLLLGRGTNIEEVNDEGYTPLMEAAREGHEEVVSILLANGADINALTEETQETALSLACCGGFKDVADLLMRNEADLELGSSTPLMEAAQEGHRDLVGYLLTCGANVNAQSPTSDTALTYASENGHTDVAEILLQEHESEGGRTPLMKACRAGHFCAVQFLLSRGANMHKTTVDNDHTPLSLACAGGHVRVVELLLANGANPFYKLKDNSTMLMEASKGGHINVIKLLVDYPNSLLQGSTLPMIEGGVASEGEPLDVAAQLAMGLSAMPDLQDPRNSDAGQVVLPDVCQLEQELVASSVNMESFPITYTRPKDMSERPFFKALSKNDGYSNMEAYPSANHSHVGDMAGAMASALYQEESAVSSSGSSSRSGSVYLSPTSSIPEGFSSSQLSANIPIQERRKLVPSKKTLDKKLLQQHKFCMQKPQQHHTIPSPGTQSELFSRSGDSGYSLSETNKVSPGITPPKGKFPQRLDTGPNLKGDITKMAKNEILRAVQHRECGCGMHHDEQVDTTPHFQGSNDALATAQLVSTMENLSLQSAGDMGVTPMPYTNFQSNPIPPSITFATGPSLSLPTPLSYMTSPAMTSTLRPANIKDILPDRVSPKNSTLHDPRAILSNIEKMKIPYKRQLTGNNIRKPKKLTNEEAKDAWQKMEQLGCEIEPVRHLPVGAFPSLAMPPRNLFSMTTIPSGYNTPSEDQVMMPLTSPSIFKTNKYAPEFRPEIESPPINQTVATMEDDRVGSVPYSDINCQYTNAMDINCETDTNKDTALTLAAAGGHKDLVLLLLSRGANVDHSDKKGYTPLLLASSAGHLDIVNILLKNNCNTEAQVERTKDTALCLACSNGRCEVVETLVSNAANKEHRNVSDYTPLSIAASSGFLNIVKELLKNGAEINARTGSKLGISPLMLASMNGNVPCVSLLLDKSADVNAQIETNRNTALTLASFQGRHEVVTLLVEKKANIEHRAKTGLTPLMEAASGGHVEVGRVLLRKGADVNASPVPVSRDTALTIAADKGHIKFVNLLIDAGASIEVKNKKGNTPLWLATSNGHFEVVKALLNVGANIESEDNRKVSCLTAAFKKGHLELVKYMTSIVSQLPGDSELERYIRTISPKDKESKELRANCTACFDVIKIVKEKKSRQADKHASDLLQMIYSSNDKKNKENRKRKSKVKEKKKKKQEVKRESKRVLEREKEEKIEEHSDVREVEETKHKVDDPLEEKGGDGGIDSNSQTSATSETKTIEEVSVTTTKKKKKKKPDIKEDPKKITVIEPPTPAKNERENVKKAIDAVIRKSDSYDSSAPLQATKAKSNVKAAKESEDSRREKKPIDISSLFDMKLVGHKKKQSFYSGIDALDAFGEVEGMQSSRPISTNVPSSSKPAGSNHKKLNRREEEWKEVVRKAKKVSVPSNAIGRVIGGGGGNINLIREVSGAHIEVEKQGKSQGDRMVIIKGSMEATKQAHNLINALVNEPDKDLTELLPKSYIKGSKTRSTYENSYGTKVIRSNNQGSEGSSGLSSNNKVCSPHNTLSSPKRTQSVQNGSKSPAVRQLFPPPPTSKIHSSQVVETQTFASKVADAASRTSTKKEVAVGRGSIPNVDNRGSERSQYSIFNNPLSEATQEVAFGSKEKKSFARAASGAIAPSKQPLGQQGHSLVVTKLADAVEKQQEVDRGRAPGYRDTKAFMPIPLLDRNDSEQFKVTSVEKVAASLPAVSAQATSVYKSPGVNTVVSSSSRPLQMHSTNMTAPLNPPIPVISAPVSVAPLARSAPGTPVASPSMRTIIPHPVRQTATPPPKSTLDFPQTFNPVVGGSKTPPVNLANTPMNQPVHPMSTHDVQSNMSNTYAGPPAYPANATTLNNLAAGAPTGSQPERSFSNYAVGQPFRNNPQMADLVMQHQHQPNTNTMAGHSHHQNAGPSLQQVINSQNQYSQQLHHIQQLAPHVGGQAYSNNVANLAQLMNNMRMSAPLTNTQPVFTNVMTPITATPLHSTLNPNAPQFLSRGENIIAPQTNRTSHIAAIPNFIPNAGVIAGLNMNQFPSNVGFDNGIQLPANIDMMTNIMQSRAGNVGAQVGYRNPGNISNPGAPCDPHSANESPTHAPAPAQPGNPAMAGFVRVDDRQSKLQPIGTERAQKRGRIVAPQLPRAPMNVMGAGEQAWIHPDMQSVAQMNAVPMEQMMPPQQQQPVNVFYAQSPEINTYNQPLWTWGPDMN